MAKPPMNADYGSALDKVRFILLMRHAKHISAETPPTKGMRLVSALLSVADMLLPTEADRSPAPRRKLCDDGLKETRSVAERLKEHIEESGGDFSIEAIITADSDEAKATAEIANEIIRPRLYLKPVDFLDPKTAYPKYGLKDGGLGFAREVKNKLDRVVSELRPEPGGNQAIMIVGHQPILGWLGHLIVEKAHPLAHSEVLCLERKRPQPARLRWAIAPTDLAAIQDLKEKIRSKMDVAKLLSSFLGGGLSFLLGTMANREAAEKLGGHIWPFAIGSLCLLAALGFFLWTMCSYDALLMPHRMWAETPRGRSEPPAWIVERPPSPVNWILYQNMIRIWQWQFLPATGLMLAGLWMLTSAVFIPHLFPSSSASDYYSILAVLALAVIAGKGCEHLRDFLSAAACPGIASKIHHLCGPWLGSED